MSKRPNFPKIRGFEFFPAGKLLNQRVDFNGTVGIAYERCIGYTKPEHSHDRMTITFPRGSSRSFITTFPEGKKFKLNQDNVHLMSQDHLHEQGSVSAVYDTFAIFIRNVDYERHLASFGAKKKDIDAFLQNTQTIRRSSILKELIQRYFLCRVFRADVDEAERQYLESLLLSELFSFSRADSRTAPPRLEESPATDETALIRAVEMIESHLFENLQVAAIVSAAKTSQASLFRLFKRDLKVSPIEYMRNRRLDEARSLLQSGDYQVGDVALLVGYEDLSAFSKAFKIRFEIPPSQVIRRR